jgi:outer membrane protein
MANVSDGTAVTLRFSRNFQIDPAFRLTPSISVEWLNAKYVDYYYGVRPAEALPNRPVYEGRDTVDIGAGVAGALRISLSWSLLGGLYGTRHGSGISDSPMVKQSFSTLVYFGAGWIF